MESLTALGNVVGRLLKGATTPSRWPVLRRRTIQRCAVAVPGASAYYLGSGIVCIPARAG
jgi:hypothetical protein